MDMDYLCGLGQTFYQSDMGDIGAVWAGRGCKRYLTPQTRREIRANPNLQRYLVCNGINLGPDLQIHNVQVMKGLGANPDTSDPNIKAAIAGIGLFAFFMLTKKHWR